MPKPRLGPLPMTAAARQARHRAKLRPSDTAQSAAPRDKPAGSSRPTAPRRPPRPQRWAAAVATLVALQEEYRAWLDGLPENLADSRTADKLQAITEIDLDELQAIDPPRGYGRD